MTLRDEIVGEFVKRHYIMESNGEVADRIIDNVIRPRFNEIWKVAKKISTSCSFCSEDGHDIVKLCFIKESEDK